MSERIWENTRKYDFFPLRLPTVWHVFFQGETFKKLCLINNGTEKVRFSKLDFVIFFDGGDLKINKNYVLITHRWADVNKILSVFFFFLMFRVKVITAIFIITAIINIIITVYITVV